MKEERRCAILCVDDETPNIALLEEILERHGHVVYSAANGMAALHLLDTHPEVKVCFLDLTMPVMDGYAVLGILSDDERYAALKIIVTSDHLETDFERIVKEWGIDTRGVVGYLSKPLFHRDILDLIDFATAH